MTLALFELMFLLTEPRVDFTYFITSLPDLSHWPLGNFRHVIFKWILVIDGWGIPCEIALIWMSPDFTDDQSTLVQAMAWCRQATSHCLSQCWPRSPSHVTSPGHNELTFRGGVTKLIFSMFFFRFSKSSEHPLPVEYQIHIWQVSPQLSCGDTC